MCVAGAKVRPVEVGGLSRRGLCWCPVAPPLSQDRDQEGLAVWRTQTDRSGVGPGQQ